jgi:hypothetical protein
MVLYKLHCYTLLRKRQSVMVARDLHAYRQLKRGKICVLYLYVHILTVYIIRDAEL